MRHRWWIGVVLLAACGPKLDATKARNVIIELEAHEYVDTCMSPCGRAARPGEHIARCKSSEAGWHLNPRFEGETSPPAAPEVFDMAARLGPLAAAYALCSFEGGAR
jgi:hypothetical protein